ncbi:terminase large subunit [Pedobacter sp. SYSU D00535]|uniref:terminase large subunit n=1 Tax=Pedobacter sp. SYSU D00535 TaxID=2810308 RepID=UPI001A974606|nr:terminase large subunit [Pedobacter sp. SYSU D00535]
MFEVSPVYEENFNSKAKIKINQGGTWSGKTYSILQLLCTHAISDPNSITTVAGQDVPNLKAGPIRDFQTILKTTPGLPRFIESYNKSDRVVQFHNGSIIEFKSYEDAQDAHSGKRTRLFINECNGVSYEIFKQLYIRTSKDVFLDYNPSSEFWVHELVLGNRSLYPSVQRIISDHRHNPFLTQEQHDSIERLKYEDEETFKVYARGLTGKIEGAVLTRCFMIEDDQYPNDAKLLGGGLDFGFTNDPTGFLEVRMQEGELWVREHIYETGLTNPMISERLKELNWNSRDEIIADSAEPKSIKELQDLRWKVEPAMKGPDSIRSSIEILNRYKINYTRSSVNFHKEQKAYIYKKDRKTGKSTNEPIDAFNHLIDPLRYVALNKLSAYNKPVKAPKYSF